MQSPRRRGIGLAAGDALRAIYFQGDFMAAGGLMSYGADLAAAYRQAAGIYAGKILSGARPLRAIGQIRAADQRQGRQIARQSKSPIICSRSPTRCCTCLLMARLGRVYPASVRSAD